MEEFTAPRIATERLGRCPACEASIPTDVAMIQYVPAVGWPEILAECPSCRDAVHPL